MNEFNCRKLTPKEFELSVKEFINDSGSDLIDMTVKHSEVLNGSDGDYEIDVVAEIVMFAGAQVTFIIECKHWTRPVTRDAVILLKHKVDKLGHKGLLFSSSGFQSGAFKVAKENKIALIQQVTEGWDYLEKSQSKDRKTDIVSFLLEYRENDDPMICPASHIQWLYNRENYPNIKI